MAKKAASQIWWIIIAAVMALVVVIIVMSILTGRISAGQGSFSDCASKGGYCEPNPESRSCSEVCRLKGETNSPLFTCPKVGESESCCCLSLKKGVNEACTINTDCREGLECREARCQETA